MPEVAAAGLVGFQVFVQPQADPGPASPRASASTIVTSGSGSSRSSNVAASILASSSGAFGNVGRARAAMTEPE
jgi:hypothetical protein